MKKKVKKVTTKPKKSTRKKESTTIKIPVQKKPTTPVVYENEPSKRKLLWRTFGFLFLISGLFTVFYRGMKMNNGVLSIDLGFVIGGFFFLLVSFMCLPKTFSLINRKGKINLFVRLVLILIFYILAVFFAFFTA